ncbi:hypothetical protein AB0A73_23290 [Glycomyces sp. NPDC047369]
MTTAPAPGPGTVPDRARHRHPDRPHRAIRAAARSGVARLAHPRRPRCA